MFSSVLRTGKMSQKGKGRGSKKGEGRRRDGTKKSSPNAENLSRRKGKAQ
jgi:hypothetical protein